MEKSVSDSSLIKSLLKSALTDKINNLEMFMKGVDYSYYYEQENEITGGKNKYKQSVTSSVNDPIDMALPYLPQSS